MSAPDAPAGGTTYAVDMRDLVGHELTDDATADKPTSHWPDGGSSQPRPSVVAVWKKSGNIGS